MKRFFSFLLVLFLFPAFADAFFIARQRGRTTEVESACYGITSIGGSEGSVNNEFMVKVVIPAGGDTLRYSYFYGNTTDGGSDGTFSVVVFEDDKSTVAIAHTSENPMIDGSDPAWNEIDLGENPLTAGTYWMQICPSEAIDYYWATSASDCFYQNVTCPSPASANTCSQTPTFKACNYDAHDLGGEGDAQSYYVTQSGAGSQNGLSLANAWAVSDFNNAANWSGSESPGAIDPGDTVYFSGSITSQIYVKGSGTASNYITIDGSSATIDVDTSGTPKSSILVLGYDYLKLDHFTIDGQLTPANNLPNAYAGVWIQGYEGNPAEYIDIDDLDVSDHRSGVWMYENNENITVTNSYFHNLCGNGVVVGQRSNVSGWMVSDTITVGGSSNNGNTFYNVGYNTDSGDTGSSPAIETQFTEDFIASYNHIYVDSTGFGWGGIMIQEGQRVLLEYNIIHGIRCTNFRGGIVVKEDSTYWENDDIIIRFNHIYDIITTGRPVPWGGEVSGINVGTDVKDAFIYGNYIHDTHWGIRIMENFSGTDGRDNENIYTMANVVAETEEEGICFNGTQDNFVNCHVFNNTVYKAAQVNALLSGYQGANISIRGAGAGQMDNTVVKNNLIMESRPNKADNEGVYWPIDDSDVLMDYNHHYHTGGTPKVYFDSTLYSWNGAIPYSIGDNDSEGNPYLTDPANGDFTLTASSTNVDCGEGTDMGTGNIQTLTIQGVSYPIPWDFVLGETTSWHDTNPDLIVIEERNADTDGWPIGAFSSE